MWKFWFTWGIDKGTDAIKPLIPAVDDIQPNLVKHALQNINVALCEKGEADLYPRGLQPESIKAILDDARSKGYKIWKATKTYVGCKEYTIGLQETSWLKEYAMEISEGI